MFHRLLSAAFAFAVLFSNQPQAEAHGGRFRSFGGHCNTGFRSFGGYGGHCNTGFASYGYLQTPFVPTYTVYQQVYLPPPQVVQYVQPQQVQYAPQVQYQQQQYVPPPQPVQQVQEVTYAAPQPVQIYQQPVYYQAYQTLNYALSSCPTGYGYGGAFLAFDVFRNRVHGHSHHHNHGGHVRSGGNGGGRAALTINAPFVSIRRR